MVSGTAHINRQIAHLNAIMDRNEAHAREHPALRAENERRAEEREAIYREVFGLPDMSRIEARKHWKLAEGKGA